MKHIDDESRNGIPWDDIENYQELLFIERLHKSLETDNINDEIFWDDFIKKYSKMRQNDTDKIKFVKGFQK